MKGIELANVRNFAFLGHTGSGKTTLVDALLYLMKISDRLGSPDDGTSVADWTDEEKERRISLFAKPFDGQFTAPGAAPTRYVFMDTPGYADFVGQMIAASAVADAGVIVVDAISGFQVGSQRAWRRCEELGLPRALVITGLDRENADFDKALAAVRDVCGPRCMPVTLPTPDLQGVVDVFADESPAALDWRAQLTEAAAETEDALIEKYLGGEALSAEELERGLRTAVRNASLVPVFAVAAKRQMGLEALLGGMARLLPAPGERPFQTVAGETVDAAASAPFLGLVWRSVIDPFVGQLTYVRVVAGTLKADSEVMNVTKGHKERIGVLYLLHGKKQETTTEAQAGDIVALAKLKTTVVNDTLGAAGHEEVLPPIQFPNPVMAYAVTPKTQGDEDKLGGSIHRLCEEDPTLRVERNTETKEMIIMGMGDVHLDTALARMAHRNHVEVDRATPKVAYRETVTGTGEGHYRHKKQSGGRGQFGEVYLRVSPRDPGEEEWFVNGIVGGSIPSNFIPAVEKGLVDGMTRGAVAGYPVMNVKVTIYDGSYHDVDSSEIAFKIAGRGALRDGMGKAKPVLLEPIMQVKVMVPDQHLGDINGDLNHRRGRILGMANEDGMQVITADVPQAEMFSYCSQLRSMTGGRGSFEMEFSRYEVVPSNVAQKVIAEAQRLKEEEE